MLQNIDIDRIFPHPNNPRQDLGDLTELAESIKANGIRQNLTLVPKEPDKYQKQIAGKKNYTGDYTVIIGHRRTAAAQLAGLAEVPCIVVIMDESSQLATMLEENMQRSDLTPYEQAQGIQLMLDLGETVFTVAEKTGFSESKVRRRIKLLELDKEKFLEAEQRGATLADYAELEKINSPELKNKVLDAIGTSNFNWELSRAVDKEKQDAKIAALISELESFATPVDSMVGMKIIGTYTPHTKFKRPEDADTEDYYYRAEGWHTYLLKKETEEPDPAQSQRERQLQRLQKRISQLDAIKKRANEMRREFIANFSPKKKHLQDVMAFAVHSLMLDGWRRFHYDELGKMLWPNLTEDECAEFTFKDLAESFTACPERILLQAAYCKEMDSSHWGYHNGAGKYERHEKLDALYDSLIKLGYEMSDEEKALRNGTHELFVQEGEDD